MGLADELSLAVTSLLVEERGVRRVIGPCTIMRFGNRIAGVTSSAVSLRAHGHTLLCATRLDGTEALATRFGGFSRYSGTSLFQLGAMWPVGDVMPAPQGAVGLGAAFSMTLVGIEPTGEGAAVRRVLLDARAANVAWVSNRGDDKDMVVVDVDKPPPATWMMDGGAAISRYAASRVLGTPAQAVVTHVCCVADGTKHVPGRTPPSPPFAELVPVQ
jgi:hypothetical protein